MRFPRLATSFFLVWTILLLSCSPKPIIRILVAEDQSSHLKDIHRSLMQGRTIGLVNAEKMRGLYRFNLDADTDTMNLPEKTANAFREGKERTDLYLGVPSSECAQVAKYISDTYQIPFITDSYDDTLVDHVNTVSVFNHNPFNVGKLTARYFYYYLKKNKVSVLVDEDTLSNQQMANGFEKEASLIGLHTSQNTFHGNSPKTDFNRILVTMKSWDPEIVFICTDANRFDTILTTLKQVFSSPPMIFLNRLPREESIQNNASLYETTQCVTVFFEQKPSFLDSSFFRQYQTEFNRPPDYYAALGYDEIMLIAELVQRKANQKQGDWFNDCKGWKTDTKERYLTGFLGFDQDGLAQKPIDIVSIRNGKPVFQNEYWTETSLRR